MGTLRACNSENHTDESVCCTAKKEACCSVAHNPRSMSDLIRHSLPDSDCSDEKDCNDCHCPGCGVRGASSLYIPVDVQLSLVLGLDARHKRAAFYFSDHLPEPVYLPIWQPPQWLA